MIHHPRHLRHRPLLQPGGGRRLPVQHPRGAGRPLRPAAGPRQAKRSRQPGRAGGRSPPRRARGAAAGPPAARPGSQGGATKRRGPGSGRQRRQALTGGRRGSLAVPSVGAAVPDPARRAGEGAAGGLSSPASSPLSAAFHGHGSPRGRGQLGEGVAAAGRSGPGWESSSPAAAQAGSGGRRRCSVRALGSFRPHQGRAGPRGPRKAGRRERGRSPRRLVAILVLLLRGAECPLPARLPALPPPPSAPPPLPGWLRWPPLPRPGEAG